MSILSLVGNDSVVINDRILSDFNAGEIAKLTFEGPIVTVKTGKNSNTIFAANVSGNRASLEIHLMRGSADDKYLNKLLTAQKSDLTTFVAMNGSLSKAFGDGKGNISLDVYTLTGGVFSDNLETSSNVEGDVEQAKVTYKLQFSIAPRTLV